MGRIGYIDQVKLLYDNLNLGNCGEDEGWADNQGWNRKITGRIQNNLVQSRFARKIQAAKRAKGQGDKAVGLSAITA